MTGEGRAAARGAEKGRAAMSTTVESFGRRLATLASEHPDATALVFAPEHGDERFVSWGELERHSNQLARLFAARGVDTGSLVVVGLWNSPAHVVTTIAAWKLGALVLPLRAVLPARERDAILELAAPALVVADWPDVVFPLLAPAEIALAGTLDNAPLPGDPPHPGKAIASGGSTGRPKIIVDRHWHPVRYPERAASLGARHGQVQLLAAPLYHNSPFLSAFGGLADRHRLVLMERFDAARAVDLIERHRVNYAYMPPIIMRRIIMLPDIATRDLSSIEALQSSAAPCPPWLKRAWIERIGAERVYEVYGSSEGIGATFIRGDEWVEHPGSVGRPTGCELKILDHDGRELPPGEPGEIFMRPLTGPPTFGYVGAPPAKSTADDFLSIGDLGWLDEDGYLYIADRRVDMIVSGGANVYPAEVEAALVDHPGIADIAVIGVPDEEWGKRVHAVVQPQHVDTPPPVEELDHHCRERLASYKVPKTWEFLAQLPRNEAGKIRRSDLAAEREQGEIPGMLRARRDERTVTP